MKNIVNHIESVFHVLMVVLTGYCIMVITTASNPLIMLYGVLTIFGAILFPCWVFRFCSYTVEQYKNKG